MEDVSPDYLDENNLLLSSVLGHPDCPGTGIAVKKHQPLDRTLYIEHLHQTSSCLDVKK